MVFMFPCKSIVSVGFLFHSIVMNAARGQEAICTFCPGGEPITRPDKLISVPGVGEYSCQTAFDLSPLLLVEPAHCELSHALSSGCGCPRQENSCDLCPDGSSVWISDTEVDTRMVPEFAYIFGGIEPSCEILEAYTHSFQKGDEFCHEVARTAAKRCGCPAESLTLIGEDNNSPSSEGGGDGGRLDYFSDLVLEFGASTIEEIRRRHMTSLSSSVLSIAGSLLLIIDCVRYQKLKMNVYNRIIFAMASYDIILSVAMAFGNIPFSTDDYVLFYNERGTRATCIAQGFFAQLGSLTSMFLNASLSTYYVLVIIKSASKSRLKKLAKYMIGIPILAGFLFGFAAIPFITNSLVGCHLRPPIGYQHIDNLGMRPTRWAAYLVLWLVPAFLVLIYSTFALMAVYLHVRRTVNNSRRWQPIRQLADGGGGTFSLSRTTVSQPSLSSRGFVHSSGGTTTATSSTRPSSHRKDDRLVTAVFWQSASFLFALYICWFTYLILVTKYNEIALHDNWDYKLWVFVSFLYPLQGFLNALIYFRCRLVRWLLKKIFGTLWASISWSGAFTNNDTNHADVPVADDPANELAAANERKQDEHVFQSRKVEPDLEDAVIIVRNEEKGNHNAELTVVKEVHAFNSSGKGEHNLEDAVE